MVPVFDTQHLFHTATDVRVCTARVTSAHMATAGVFLSDIENAILSDIPLAKRYLWCMGRLSAKRSLGAWYSAHGVMLLPTSVSIVAGDDGVPRVKYHENSMVTFPLHISISHTRECAVAAVAHQGVVRGVGVDVERVRTFSSETLDAFLSESERVDCSLRGDFLQQTTLYWCIKEAYLKARGTGLRVHPKTIEIFWDPANHDQCTILDRGVQQRVQVDWTITGDLYILGTVTLL